MLMEWFENRAGDPRAGPPKKETDAGCPPSMPAPVSLRIQAGLVFMIAQRTDHRVTDLK
jgi:hypothetical protein